MNVRRIVLLNIILFVVLFGVAYFGWNYYYQSSHFVVTDNATVQAPQVTINPEFAGDLTDWNVANGGTVSAGQVLGKESTTIELQQLGPLAKDPTIAKSVASAAVITTPMAGTLVQSTAVTGQMIAPGQPLAKVVDLSNAYILANIRETDIRLVDVGDTVDITLDAYPNLVLKGTVKSIGLAANSVFALIPPTSTASGNYSKVIQTIPVEISLSGYSGTKLTPGTNATIKIHRKSS